MADRSIRNIPVSNRQRSDMPDAVFPQQSDGGYRIQPPTHRSRGRFWFIAILVILICGAVGAVLPLLLSGASVTVLPRTTSVTPSGSITANLQSGQDSAGSGLGFQTLQVSASTTRQVASSGTTNANATAQGTITIFNKYSTSPQTLIANTRFESVAGKIYRIHQTVTVPGGTKSADGSIAPASVQAMVYADEPGPDYNTSSMQFSIPGFKGEPQYNGFYASTQGITGGSSGSEPTVLPADASKADADMQAELKTTLVQDLATAVPSGYVLVPGAVAISYTDGPSTGSGNAAVLLENGTASAAIIKSSDLASAIATASVDGYAAGQPIDFVDSTKVPVMLASGSTYAADVTTLQLSFTGPVNLVWQVNTDAIAKALAGKKKTDFDSIMDTFKPAVASASASMRPFWLPAFPGDPAKIAVKVKPAQ